MGKALRLRLKALTLRFDQNKFTSKNITYYYYIHPDVTFGPQLKSGINLEGKILLLSLDKSLI